MAIRRKFGSCIVPLIRTMRFQTGARGVLYLPDGFAIHTLEDNPIKAGTYFLRPDDTGKFKNWVVETILESRFASGDWTETNGKRYDVEFHAGNVLKDTNACILPGLETSAAGVLHSQRALAKMRAALERDAFAPKTWILVISENF